MLARLSGGAQQPLPDNHGMEGKDCGEFCCMDFNPHSPILILAAADIQSLFFARRTCFHLNLTNVSGNCTGLPMVPSFQSNTREDPLPDMQVGGGNYGGPGEFASLHISFFLRTSEMGTRTIVMSS